MGFSVIQPGSSVATSLCEGEAVPKHVAILSVTGRNYHVEPIRLKTVRPFVIREIALRDEKELKNVNKKHNNRTKVTEHLIGIVEDLIGEAQSQWLAAQEPDTDAAECPLPLIRLRVEYSSTEGAYETENPQRFSNRFIGRVANIKDVVHFHRKKTTTRRTATGETIDISNAAVLAEYGDNLENIKVESLVQEFLDKASLEILPGNGLGDAVGLFVDKNDRFAVENFVEESLAAYMTKMRQYEDLNEETIGDVITQHKSYLEKQFEAGQLKIRSKNRKYKEKPDGWDTDLDGAWEDQPAAQPGPDDESDASASASAATPAPATRGRGRGRARAGRTAAPSTRKAPAAKKTPAPKKTPARSAASRRAATVIDSDSDAAMPDLPDDDDDEAEEEEEEEVIKPTPRRRAAPAKAPAKAPARAAARKAAAPAAATRQSQLNFGGRAAREETGVLDSQASNHMFHRNIVTIPSDDEDIEEEEDDFRPMPSQRAGRRR